MNRISLLFLLLVMPLPAFAQTSTAQQVVPGYYSTSTNVCSGLNNPCYQPAADPCSFAAKSSAVINVTSALTTQLVAVSGSTSVYVCGFSLSIAPSATSADTAEFEYGTSTNCTGTHALTGTYGAGDLTTAAAPLPINYGGGNQTVFRAPASQGLCMVSVGTTVNIQGVLTYVQQ